MFFGNRITLCINRLQVTKKYFAETIKVSPGNLSDWINPKRKSNPSSEVLVRISETYNINITWLLTGKGEMFLDGSYNKEEVCIDSCDKIEKLEQEVALLKKDIAELGQDNSNLRDELVDRLRKICNLQDQLIPEST
jgi:transcriptional regulator with XRE-family HTH domain